MWPDTEFDFKKEVHQIGYSLLCYKVFKFLCLHLQNWWLKVASMFFFQKGQVILLVWVSANKGVSWSEDRLARISRHATLYRKLLLASILDSWLFWFRKWAVLQLKCLSVRWIWSAVRKMILCLPRSSDCLLLATLPGFVLWLNEILFQPKCSMIHNLYSMNKMLDVHFLDLLKHLILIYHGIVLHATLTQQWVLHPVTSQGHLWADIFVPARQLPFS